MAHTNPIISKIKLPNNGIIYEICDKQAIHQDKIGTANGIAQLDSNGRVPSSQLPSYVDDVLEYSSQSAFPAAGESGKIYIDHSTNKTYRWSGYSYVEISASLAIGTTEGTAFRGDWGKVAYDHSKIKTGNPHRTTKADLGLGNVENKSSETIRGELTKQMLPQLLVIRLPHLIQILPTLLVLEFHYLAPHLAILA